MKKLIMILVALLISIPVIGLAAFAGGDGTSANPYQITSCEQLQEIETDLNASYILTEDVDCDGIVFEAIGNSSGAGYPKVPFTGVFDGQGHKIFNLYVDSADVHIGLFGWTTSSALIKNVDLIDVDMKANQHLGGLVGYNSGTVENSSVSGTIRANGDAGGLVGYNNHGASITNSYSTASVVITTLKGYCFGGLVGTNYGTVTNAYSTGNVTGYYSTGGLIGRNVGTVTNAYSTGNVTGYLYVGGLIGDSTLLGGTPTVTSSYWDVNTSGQSISAGGIGKTTVEMKQQASFIGWDFTSVWSIDEGVSYPTFYVPSSHIENQPVFGIGSEINKGVTWGHCLYVGDNTVINKNSKIGNDVVIGNDVIIDQNATIGSNVTIGNATVIGRDSIIGNNVTIGQGVVLGKKVIVSDGTVIPDFTVIGANSII